MIGKPSLTVAKRLVEEENIRIEAQKACLGDQGLQILKAKLTHATRLNEAQIPSRIMESFPIPSVSSISSIEVLTATNPPSTTNCVQDHVNRDGHVNDIPYFIQYDRKKQTFYCKYCSLTIFVYRYFLSVCDDFYLYEYIIYAVAFKTVWTNVHGHIVCVTYTP